MFTEIIIPQETSVTLEVPKEMVGHKVKVTFDDLERPGMREFSSVEEALAQFTALEIDTRGWKFDREEANRRR